jgi:uncharacterized membrane protein YfcA
VAGIGAGFVIGIVPHCSASPAAGCSIRLSFFCSGSRSSSRAACGSLSACETILVAFARYSRDRSFDVPRSHPRFVLVMAAVSIVGALLGGLLLGVVSSSVLLPLLALILVASALKLWRHD